MVDVVLEEALFVIAEISSLRAAIEIASIKFISSTLYLLVLYRIIIIF